MTLPRRWQAYLLLLTNTITWGAALIIVKPGLDITTPFRFLLYRYVLAVVLTLPILGYYLYRKTIKNWPKTILMVTAVELTGTTLALSCLYFGLQRTTAIEASLISTTSPLFTTLAGVFWLNEKQENHEWFGLGLALIGTIMLTIVPAIGQHFGFFSGMSLIGNLLVLAHNLSSAAYFLLAKKYYAKLPKLLTSTISFYIGAISFLALSLFELGARGTDLWQLSIKDLSFPDVWMASGYMAIFGSIIGLTCYIKGQDLIETSEASWFWYLQPLVYVPLGVLWLHERITLWQLIALAFILGGVLLAEKRFRHHRPAVVKAKRRR